MPDFRTSNDGTRLAVYETGTGGPAVVAVHGYPDNHIVWDGVAAALSDRFRVVTYDVRGTGASDQPRERAAYRQDRLTDDLAAVIESVDGAVHLLGHDWGSIQCWPALTDPRVAARVATFTSISGPSLAHAAAWMRGRDHRGDTLRQLRHSWYTLAFQLPLLPEMILRSRLGERSLAANGIPAGRGGSPEMINGLNLYRANMFSALARPAPPRIGIPVQVIAPRGDRFVTVALQTQAPAPFVPNLVTHVVDGGHWLPRDRPDRVAQRLAALAGSS